MDDLGTTSKWVLFIVAVIIMIGSCFYYVGEANKCADKGGRYIIGGKNDLPVCVKEL